MHIPSASALMDVFARITRFAESRATQSPFQVDGTTATPGADDRQTISREAVSEVEDSNGGKGDFSFPPDGQIRRGMLVDIRV